MKFCMPATLWHWPTVVNRFDPPKIVNQFQSSFTNLDHQLAWVCTVVTGRSSCCFGGSSVQVMGWNRMPAKNHSTSNPSKGVHPTLTSSLSNVSFPANNMNWYPSAPTQRCTYIRGEHTPTSSCMLETPQHTDTARTQLEGYFWH